MSGDPRVQAVAEALKTHWQRPTIDAGYQCVCGVRGYRSEWPVHRAAAAVAALDAFDNSGDGLQVYKRQVEAHLRKQIAQAIESEAARSAADLRDSGDDGPAWPAYLDGFERAASIARGTDPGKDT